MTIVSGLACGDAAREVLARALRRRLGCGAQGEEGCVVLQGDQQAALRRLRG